MSLAKKEKKLGRPQEVEAKHPEQKKKMEEVLEYLKQRGWTQKRLASEVFGVDDQTFSNWTTGKSKLSLMAKKTFAHDLDVPMEYWEYPNLKIEEAIGKGLGKDEPEGPPTVLVKLIPMIEGALRAGEHGYEFTVEDLTLHYAEQVPVPIEHIKKAGPHCLIRVEGDSMEPMYYDGDVVLVNLRQQNLETLLGKPVAAWVPDLGGGLIKILKGCYRQDQWILHSINNRRPDIPVAKDQPHFRVFEVEALVYQPRKVAA